MLDDARGSEHEEELPMAGHTLLHGLTGLLASRTPRFIDRFPAIARFGLCGLFAFTHLACYGAAPPLPAVATTPVPGEPLLVDAHEKLEIRPITTRSNICPA